MQWLRFSDAVVDGNRVYVRNNAEIYSCDVPNDSWSQLPNCTERLCSLMVINGWLTTIGGSGFNKLFSLTGKGNERKWTEKFPPMTTKKKMDNSTVHWNSTNCGWRSERWSSTVNS